MWMVVENIEGIDCARNSGPTSTTTPKKCIEYNVYSSAHSLDYDLPFARE